MNTPALIRFRNDLDLVDHVAGAFLEEIQAAPPDRPYCVALSGGRVAGRFFSALAAQGSAHRAALRKVEFFWADERCVPPTVSDSNYALAEQCLLTPLSIDPRQIHRIRGEVSPDSAAAEAEAEMLQIVPVDKSGQPILDLVHLGLGEDGHIASLFPEEAEDLLASRRTYRPVVGPKPPPLRITLTYAALAAARSVWVIASGAGKEEALQRSLTDPLSTPLARLLERRRTITIFTDLPPADTRRG